MVSRAMSMEHASRRQVSTSIKADNILEKAKVILVMLCGVITASPSVCARELAEAYHDQFLTGTAISNDTLSKALPATDTPVCKEFNAFTAENAMKWQSLQPRDGEFDFSLADKLFELADR